jgi:hemerythrin-like metal-binding protein
MPYEWTPEYSMGDEQLDQQHQQLFRILNRLESALLEGTGREAIGGIIDELYQFSSGHFGLEERKVRDCACPEYPQQVRDHQRFATKIEEFRAALAGGRTLLPAEVLMFAEQWIESHLKVCDVKCRRYLERDCKSNGYNGSNEHNS